MANPQPTDAHLRIAHQISEQLMVSHFTAKQRRILDLILRLSWGCGKKEAIIPRQGDFEVVGIFKSDIKGELDLLERDGIISRDGDTYQFNKDYDKWRVSRARGYSQAKVSELLTINLSTHRQELVNHQPESKQITNKSVSELPTEPDTKLATPKEIVKESIKQSSSLSKEDVIEVYKKEIAGLYEEESLSEILEKDIEATINIFSATWVIDAIQEAVSRKNRTWHYVTGILKNWKRFGKNYVPGKSDPDKYIKGKYGHMVQR